MTFELRTHVPILMQHACDNPGLIDGAVNSALEAPMKTWLQLPLELRDAVDLQGIKDQARARHRWLDMESLLWETMKIASAPFWNHILTASDPVHAENVVKALRSSSSGAPAAMERNNKAFFGMVFPLVTIAALLGAEVKNFAGERTTSTAAMEAIGDYFATPAENGEVFIQRLRQLFPQAHADREANSAYSFLCRNDAFRAFETRRSCPVIKPTQAIFESYGRALAPSHAYGISLLSIITR